MQVIFDNPFTCFLVVVIAILLHHIATQREKRESLAEFLIDAHEEIGTCQASARFWHHLLFAQIARSYPSGLLRWGGGLQCIIDLPSGQISTWFAHDPTDPALDIAKIKEMGLDLELELEIAELYVGLPEYTKPFEESSTEILATRLNARPPPGTIRRERPVVPLRA